MADEQSNNPQRWLNYQCKDAEETAMRQGLVDPHSSPVAHTSSPWQSNPTAFSDKEASATQRTSLSYAGDVADELRVKVESRTSP